MTLPEIAIRRHVLAVMLSAVLVLFGIVSLDRLGVDRFPEIDFPIISIVTVLPGAAPEIVDTSVTDIIENAVNTVPGIEEISSSSSPGTSIVNVSFNLDKDIDVAFNEIQSQINQIIRQLPDDAEAPVVNKVEVGAAPVMWWALRGDRTQQQLNVYAENEIRPRLETVDGVGEIRIGGRRDRNIRVELDTHRMAAAGVTPAEVYNAISTEHVQFPGGFIVGRDRESMIKVDLEYHNVRELERLIVSHRDGAPIRLRDIGEVVDGLEDFRQLARFNGEPTVGLGVVRITGSNTVRIAEEITERIENEIRPQLPPGITIELATNNADLIQEIVRALQSRLLEGTLLAALVVFLFLRNFRSTLMIATAIPVSLLGAIAMMYGFGYTINVLTLLSLLLLIGVVVDDAIVVLENIYRHREQHTQDAFKAAADGSRQVFFAVVASSLTLVAIFAPVIFMGGIIGRFFESFAVVVTVGILVSTFVALTLVPMLASRFLVVEQKHGKVYERLEQSFIRIESAYRSLLDKVLKARWTTLGIAVVVFVVSMMLPIFFIETEFAPAEDEGRFIVMVRAPLGSSLEYTDNRLRKVEEALGRQEAVRTYFTAIGLGRSSQANEAIAFVNMVDRSERRISQQEQMALLREELANIPGVRAFAAPIPVIGGGMRGEPLQFMLSGPNLEQVAELSNQMFERLRRIEGMGRPDKDLQLDLPQTEIRLDRDRAADLGITARDVGFAINLMAGGLDVARYNDVPGDGQRYDLRVKAREGTFATEEDLSQIYLRASSGELVRLDSVASFEPVIGPAAITRFNMRFAAQFYLDPDMPMGSAVEEIDRIAGEILPLGYGVRYIGEADEMQQTVGHIRFAFVLGLILVFMVLSSQFNSYAQPLMIMGAQPLAMLGGFWGLFLTGNTLNIFSMIAMLLLIGLVAKNAILLVDITNQYRERGMGVDEALREACPVRLRPVLMTSLTLILALLPAALGVGVGGDSNAALAVTIIGGMVSSTALTLVVIPAIYSLAENWFESRGYTRARA